MANDRNDGQLRRKIEEAALEAQKPEWKRKDFYSPEQIAKRIRRAEMEKEAFLDKVHPLRPLVLTKEDKVFLTSVGIKG